MEQPMKRLYRSRTDRILGGVCGGLGEYFQIDPTLVRVAFVIFAFGGGFGVLAYVILWIVIPEATQTAQPLEQRAQTAGEEMKDSVQKIATNLNNGDGANGRIILGVILVAVGFMAFGHTFFPWSWWRRDLLWPLVLVAIGLSIVLKRK